MNSVYPLRSTNPYTSCPKTQILHFHGNNDNTFETFYIKAYNIHFPLVWGVIYAYCLSHRHKRKRNMLFKYIVEIHNI